MLQAAENRPAWREYPLCCQMTGLTLKYGKRSIRSRYTLSHFFG
ncbi:hypothetical protein [uncultured Desulfosarcina sp.]|nr:hypothetical protein [uncultured Desulfosarcina sp.]